MNDVDNVKDMYVDVIRELGNIGAGNAATALSALINKRIALNVTEVKIVPFNNLENAIGNTDMPVVGIYLLFEGDINGTIIFILDDESAKNIRSFFEGLTGAKPAGEITELDISMLKEIGNILAGAYLKALNDMTGLSAMQSIPLYAYDMIGAILSVPLIEFGQEGDNAMIIDTEFIDGAKTIKGHFFILPEGDAFKIIFKALGAKL